MTGCQDLLNLWSSLKGNWKVQKSPKTSFSLRSMFIHPNKEPLHRKDIVLARRHACPWLDNVLDKAAGRNRSFCAGAKRKREEGSEEQGEADHGPLYHFKPWLGFWEPAFDKIKTTTELVLQVPVWPLLPSPR